MNRIAVLASGGGSNLQAIIDNVESGYIPDADVVVVISDKSDAFSLERARKAGIEALHINPGEYASRADYDSKVIEELKARRVDLVLLAGYMRIMSPVFVESYPNRIMNIHPALLPSFPGMHGQKDALDWGVKVSGATVHFVDEEVDHGPIIIQAAVPVLEDDSVESLAARILNKEHVIYPEAVKLFCEGRLKVQDRGVEVKGVRQVGILEKGSRE